MGPKDEDNNTGRGAALGSVPESLPIRKARPSRMVTQMYVNYFDRVLCSDKNDAMVRITLPQDNEQILAARYQMYLPTEEELRAELTRERHEAERVLAVSADHGRKDE